jgi:hypothetical protein
MVEVIYSVSVANISWSQLPAHLLSGPRIALYVGILLAYITVIGILIKLETNIGLRQLDLNELADRLGTAKSFFAVGTLSFDEWFDPAVQVYFTTTLQVKLAKASFRYERILLPGSSSARIDLDSDYLDGYHAKCLIGIHKRLGINLYFIDWPQLLPIIDKLSLQEKIDVGFFSSSLTRLPEKLKQWIFRKIGPRVRRAAVGIIESDDGSKAAFRFSKHAQIVSVQFEPPSRSASCVKFVESLKEEIYKKGTTAVKPSYDFTGYY